jgi:hypothetical protein
MRFILLHWTTCINNILYQGNLAFSVSGYIPFDKLFGLIETQLTTMLVLGSPVRRDGIVINNMMEMKEGDLESYVKMISTTTSVPQPGSAKILHIIKGDKDV